VTKLTLVVDGRPDVDIDLTGKHLTDSARFSFLYNVLAFGNGVRDLA